MFRQVVGLHRAVPSTTLDDTVFNINSVMISYTHVLVNSYLRVNLWNNGESGL